MTSSEPVAQGLKAWLGSRFGVRDDPATINDRSARTDSTDHDHLEPIPF